MYIKTLILQITLVAFIRSESSLNQYLTQNRAKNMEEFGICTAECTQNLIEWARCQDINNVGTYSEECYSEYNIIRDYRNLPVCSIDPPVQVVVVAEKEEALILTPRDVKAPVWGECQDTILKACNSSQCKSYFQCTKGCHNNSIASKLNLKDSFGDSSVLETCSSTCASGCMSSCSYICSQQCSNFCTKACVETVNSIVKQTFRFTKLNCLQEEEQRQKLAQMSIILKTLILQLILLLIF